MLSTGLIEEKIPGGSFFDCHEYAGILDGHPQGKQMMPFVLYGLLTGIEEIGSRCLAGTQGIELNVGDDTYLLVTQAAPEVWQGLPVRSHHLIEPNQMEFACLQQALQHLAVSYPEGYQYFQEFTRAIMWVDLRAELRGDVTQITSSSFPILPLCVLITGKALRHIPPNTVCDQTSHRFLAENLFHEAIHQAVNMNLLLCDIFTEQFDSETSPKIEIPWRTYSEVRNQYWELDRTFHAAVVYNHVLGYRMAQLKDESLLPFERKAFEEAARAGAEAAKYLSGALLHYEHFFTPDGLKVARSLDESIQERWQMIQP